jgi:hypothetical protein
MLAKDKGAEEDGVRVFEVGILLSIVREAVDCQRMRILPRKRIV